MNRYVDHLYVIPEDDCDRQLADGFALHDQVNTCRVQIMPPADGWAEVLRKFQTEYVKHLKQFPLARVVMVIDFDGDYINRRARFENEIPAEVKDRVFVIGARQNPEELKQSLGRNFEDIGKSLADACFRGIDGEWNSDHLKHNSPDVQRLIKSVKPFLFL